MLCNTHNLAWRPLIHTLLIAIISALAWFLVKLYLVRSKLLALQRQGLPMPPYHPLFGHLLLSRSILSQLPDDLHGHYLPGLIRRALPGLPPVYYLDNWPFTTPMLVVTSPTGASQACQDRSLPKFAALRSFMKPLTGGDDLVTMEGKEWKAWRTIFNPGFSAGHLMTLVPGIVKDASTYCQILRDHAMEGRIFSMEKAATDVTMDIIGRVSLNNEWHAQGSGNEMVSALSSQVHWLCFGSEGIPLKLFNPLRPLMNWYNTRRMDRYITRELQEHLHTCQDELEAGSKHRSKSVIDLALNTYLTETSSAKKTTQGMDEKFKSFAIAQTKLFIFSGHDTTSSTICYIYHQLSQDSEALRHIRAEHDSIFGKDISQTASIITEKPILLNQLPYTVAVIKEALRLFPAASSIREGQSDYSIKEPNGLQYPTSGFLVWVVHQAMHRDPQYWVQPDSFLPSRWLVPEGDPLHPIKGAWRPFEFGPRNCIGQELAMLEMKIILAMTAREFCVRAAYDEWDVANPTRRPKTVRGERAYQIVIGSAHPCDKFPCRVKLAN